jgi:hypothetical protein
LQLNFLVPARSRPGSQLNSTVLTGLALKIFQTNELEALEELSLLRQVSRSRVLANSETSVAEREKYPAKPAETFCQAHSACCRKNKPVRVDRDRRADFPESAHKQTTRAVSRHGLRRTNAPGGDYKTLVIPDCGCSGLRLNSKVVFQNKLKIVTILSTVVV